MRTPCNRGGTARTMPPTVRAVRSVGAASIAPPPAPAGGRRSALEPGEGGTAGVDRRLAEFLLDPEQLIVFGDPLAAGRRSGLDLSGVGGDGQVRDCGVLGLAGAVGQDRRVAAALGEAD